MLETGKFVLAGRMGEVNPGNPSSDLPYYRKLDDMEEVPSDAVVEEGEFAVAMVEARFDPKTKEPKGKIVYYVKATESVKAQVQKNCDDLGRFLAWHLREKEKEYREKGLDFWAEMKKKHEEL